MVLKRIMLTGASGMTGHYVLEEAANRGILCVASSRRRPDSNMAICDWHHWDLAEWRSPESLDTIVGPIDAIVHLGAAVPNAKTMFTKRDLIEMNVRGSLCLGEYALHKDVPLVYLSGAVVYSNPYKDPIFESDEKIYENCIGGTYGYSKYMAELVFKSLVNQGLRLTVLRPSSIYGVGLAEEKMIMRFLRLASAGEEIFVMPPYEDRIDFVYAADVADAVFDALEAEAYGEYNIGGNIQYSTNEVVDLIINIAGKGSIKKANAYIKKDPSVKYAMNCDKAMASFGYSPKTTLNDGIRHILNNL